MSRLFAVLFMLLMPVAAGAEVYAVPAQFWLSPRSGEIVRAEPMVAQAVQRFLVRPRARLVLHHAREDESMAHAEELRGWLIALGLEAQRIELAETGGVDRTVKIEVTAE
jgi:hypothetical protein